MDATPAPTTTELWLAMSDLVYRHGAQAHERLGSLIGMPFSRFRALSLVSIAARTQNDLARALNVDRSAVSVIVNHLVRKGLVVRQAHPRDRRYTVVAVTPAGQQVVESVTTDPLIAPAIFHVLDKDQRRQLNELLAVLRHGGSGGERIETVPIIRYSSSRETTA